MKSKNCQKVVLKALGHTLYGSNFIASDVSLIHYKGYNSKFKFFDGVQFQKYFISLPCILLDYAHEITKEF